MTGQPLPSEPLEQLRDRTTRKIIGLADRQEITRPSTRCGGRCGRGGRGWHRPKHVFTKPFAIDMLAARRKAATLIWAPILLGLSMCRTAPAPVQNGNAASKEGKRLMKLLTSLAVLALAASPSMAMAQAMNMGANASPSDKAFTSSMQRMMENMDVKRTGNTDKDFFSMMMPHHQGAIDMAKVELRYGKDPMLRKMAAGIVQAQEKEIDEMKSWQAKNK